MESNIDVDRQSEEIVVSSVDFKQAIFEGETDGRRKDHKNVKGVSAEEKRRRCVAAKVKAYIESKNIIKNALASVGSSNLLNKKIKLEVESEREANSTRAINKPNVTLFSSDDESDDMKKDFTVHKNEKYVNLQSKLAHDDRFTLDKRFIDSDEEDIIKTENTDEEKNTEYSVFQSVIGYQVPNAVGTKRSNELPMIRYDPDNLDHKQFELSKQDNYNKESCLSKSERTHNKSCSDGPKESVSSERYYDVNVKLKDSLRGSENKHFSFLEVFGPSKSDEANEGNEMNNKSEESMDSSVNKRRVQGVRNPFRYDSTDTESEDEQKKEHNDEITPIKTIQWAETFFFQDNDPRFLDAKAFMAGVGFPSSQEDFVTKRRSLKRIVRSKVRNHDKKKIRYNNKLGGTSKRINRHK